MVGLGISMLLVQTWMDVVASSYWTEQNNELFRASILHPNFSIGFHTAKRKKLIWEACQHVCLKPYFFKAMGQNRLGGRLCLASRCIICLKMYVSIWCWAVIYMWYISTITHFVTYHLKVNSFAAGLLMLLGMFWREIRLTSFVLPVLEGIGRMGPILSLVLDWLLVTWEFMLLLFN